MFTCSSCQYTANMKLGKCPQCGDFGTFLLDVTKTKKTKVQQKHEMSGGVLLLGDEEQAEEIFWSLQTKEFARVLPPGVKKGGVYLLGGAPGVGKSTFILQILQDMCQDTFLAFGYFSGEEQANAIQKRKERITNPQPPCQGAQMDVFHATHLDDILTTIEVKKYDCVVIDSIQTIYATHLDAPAGSPNQVKYCAEKISEFAKKTNTTIWIIGHITKGGEIAGPKYLEHIVDVVLYLEGERFSDMRFLRCTKNRFGGTDDVGVFDMTSAGMCPVYDLAHRIIAQATTHQPGSVFTIGLDTARPVLAVIEVLLTKSYKKHPECNCVGVDRKRVDLIAAILQRYCGVSLGMMDVYVHIPGEFTFYDSGIDLAIAAALFGAYHSKTFGKDTVFIGELGLTGRVVKSKQHEKRKKEIPDGFVCFDSESIPSIRHIQEMVK